MTDQEKLNQLFNAALTDSTDYEKPLARALIQQVPAPAALPITASDFMQVTLPTLPPIMEMPLANAGLDATASAELGALLDEQRVRLGRKRRRETLVTLGVCLTLTGGSCGWFVQSPNRIQAFKEVMRDFRSFGDVQGMVAKYKVALDKIAVRSKQIDQATAAMGVKHSAADDKDPYFEKEMQAMMGGKGRTVGQRNTQLQKTFGQPKLVATATKDQVALAKDQVAPAKDQVATVADGQSFEWKH